jgi:hypothetical protein
MKIKKMKPIYRVKDKFGGMIEVQVLDRNNKVPEDLIWLHCKTKKPKQEDGMIFTPAEARIVIGGLFFALDYIIRQYKLEKFKIKR